jgi:23S rRNA (uracil1939-C5)-methyltransferase
VKSPSFQQPPAEWQIDKLVPGGDGFARFADGRTGFARGALPGERIEVSSAEERKSYRIAQAFRVLAPSSERVEPVCAVQQRCGGCDWMMLRYEAQLREKANLLREALTRTGRLQDLPEIAVAASPELLGYRSRMRLQVARDGRLGFFSQASHELVEVPLCHVVEPRLNGALSALRALPAALRAELAGFAELELRASPAASELGLRLIPRSERGAAGARPSPALRAALSAFRVTVADKAADEGADPAADPRWPLPEGVTLRAPDAAFLQINWGVNLELVRALCAGARARGAERFLDLYAGAGNFSLPLAKLGLKGLAIEASRAAIAAARRAASEQGLAELRFVAGDVAQALARLPRDDVFDLVVLDPPRSGARAVLTPILERRPRSIAYCACDPVTLARDLRVLVDGGYRLAELAGFDMFPQTHHFETLAWLERAAEA